MFLKEATRLVGSWSESTRCRVGRREWGQLRLEARPTELCRVRKRTVKSFVKGQAVNESSHQIVKASWRSWSSLSHPCSSAYALRRKRAS